MNTIYAVAVCMSWLDGSQNCQITQGRPDWVYHQSRDVCSQIVATMNTSRPEGNNPSISYECVKKDIPTWQRQ